MTKKENCVDANGRENVSPPGGIELEEHIDKVKRSIRTTHKKMKKLGQVKKKQ